MEDTVKTEGPAVVPEEKESTLIDSDSARIAELEADNARLIEESANYKLGMLKAKGKLPADEEDDEDKMRRIAREEAIKAKISSNDAEKDALYRKALKENKELKLTLQNKTKTPPAAQGTHSEGTPVTDTLITPEQLTAFKARGWTDTDIERYRRNLQKNLR